MIVVTGANGFIGSALVGELNRKGFKDLVLTDLIGDSARPDLLQGKAYSQFLGPRELLSHLETQSARPQWVFHMGACSDTTESRWDYLNEVNVEYSKALLKWCATHQIPITYASSGAIYGDGSQGFDDATPVENFNPLNLYGRSKLLVDQWVLQQTERPPKWYGLRFFNVYGPNENFKGPMSSVVFKAYGQIQEHGNLKLFKSLNPDYKDGEQMRDFVYVKDVVRWMIELMEGRAQSGIYNMGSGKARTWLDLARQTFKSIKRPMEISWIDLPEELRDRYQYFTEAAMNKWRSQGLSEPEYSLEQGVADYIEEYLQKGRYL